MEKLHFHKTLFPFFLLLFLFHLSSLQLVCSDYTPPEKYFINCGSKNTIEVDNRNFVGDENSNSISFSRKKSSTVQDNTPTTNLSALYQTARVFKQTSSYKFKIDTKGTYLVRLHFHPFSSSQHTSLTTTALFNVSVSGFSLLSNFSVPNSTNSSPVIKEFLITINQTEFILCFTPQQKTSLAFVNALEVFIAPENFIPDVASHVTPAGGSNSTFRDLLSHALQTINRINVGGDSVGSESDTLWRNWTSDNGYVLTPNSAINKTDYFSENLKYEDGNSTIYIGSDRVYRTARLLNLDSNVSNITWRFEVGKKARHFVRLHFCEIASMSLNVLEFNLYIYTKFSDIVNPYDITQGSAIPFCLDFVVDSDESGFMSISVGVLNQSDQAPFLNGLEILKFMENSTFFQESKKKNNLALILGIAAGCVALISILMVVLALKFREPSTHSDVPTLNLGLKIPLVEIKRATNNFDKRRMIGAGGFGKVYKGTLKNGTEVAVKRGESEHGQGFSEFQTEIIILSKIRHRHLVSLIGYCDERSQMILVYEYMENGTLRDHLYGSNNNDSCNSLSWKQRLDICIGSAEGLDYLHTSSDGGIIHRDVKSTNILLDRNYVAKVADFGISRSGHLDQTHVSTDVKGSIGYLDPDYYSTTQLTKKSDVYSFGVVLLEVLCARPVIDTSLSGDEVNLAEWAMSWQKRGKLEEIIDPRLVGEINPGSLRKIGETAEKCLRESGGERPSMGDVLWDLKFALGLQQAATPHEDSTTDAAMLVMQHSFSIKEDGVPISSDDGSNTTASEVFSQLRIEDPR
uniref:Protein kinase domain-containing protein n=1 Tax=Davidia involucrata TaxID=16924 RepID=A0A5B7BJD9_DAVIN